MRKLFGKLLQKDEHTNEWASEGCFVIVCDQNQKNQSKKKSDQTDTLNGRQTETISQDCSASHMFNKTYTMLGFPKY